jgi:hypothetical protein
MPGWRVDLAMTVPAPEFPERMGSVSLVDANVRVGAQITF